MTARDGIPEDRDARLAFLEEWAEGQERRLNEEAQRRWDAERIARAEEQRRRYAEQIPDVLAQARQRTGRVDSLRHVAAIPVVITKPSDVPADRAAVFGDLMARLREYKWADPIVSVCDERADIAPKAIDLARRHRPEAPWLLYMEDDVILGPDFGLLPGLLSEADELFPDTGLVSFFSASGHEPRECGWSTRPMELFAWLQCVAIRNTDHLVGFRSASRNLSNWPDSAVGNFLAAEFSAYAVWCPSLVQHAGVTSAFVGARTEAFSESYNQAYG